MFTAEVTALAEQVLHAILPAGRNALRNKLGQDLSPQAHSKARARGAGAGDAMQTSALPVDAATTTSDTSASGGSASAASASASGGSRDSPPAVDVGDAQHIVSITQLSNAVLVDGSRPRAMPYTAAADDPSCVVAWDKDTGCHKRQARSVSTLIRSSAPSTYILKPGEVVDHAKPGSIHQCMQLNSSNNKTYTAAEKRGGKKGCSLEIKFLRDGARIGTGLHATLTCAASVLAHGGFKGHETTDRLKLKKDKLIKAILAQLARGADGKPLHYLDLETKTVNYAGGDVHLGLDTKSSQHDDQCVCTVIWYK